MKTFAFLCVPAVAAWDAVVTLQSQVVESTLSSALNAARSSYSAWKEQNKDVLEDALQTKRELKSVYLDMRRVRERVSAERDEKTRHLAKFDLAKAFANLTQWLKETKHSKVQGWYAKHALKFEKSGEPKLEKYPNSSEVSQWTGVPTVVMLLIDALFVVMSAMGKHCPIVNFLVYYVGGAMVMMLDQQLSFDDVALVLAQQVTTVGYGSSTVGTYGLKLYHGLHAFLGVTEIAPVLNSLVKASLYFFNRFWKLTGTKFEFLVPAALETIVSTMVMAEDLRQADGGSSTFGDNVQKALYLVMATASSIGYGDLNPSTAWGKLLTPFMATALTASFAEVGEHLGTKIKQPTKGDIREQELKDRGVDSLNFMKLFQDWVDQCADLIMGTHKKAASAPTQINPDNMPRVDARPALDDEYYNMPRVDGLADGEYEVGWA